MKKIILAAIMLLSCVSMYSQNVVREGTTFKQVATSRSKEEPQGTGFMYEDTKGNKYPIFISKSGSCFIVKTSKKTGKEYRQYLGEDISKQICLSLGVEYKSKTKSE